MSEAFLKAVKWYIIALAAIIGTSAFMIADNHGSVRPVMVGVLGYGVVYGMSLFWKDLRGKVLLLSMIVFLVISFSSAKIPMFLYVWFGFGPFVFDPYFLWGLSMGVIGIPVMAYIFYKYD